MTPPDFVIKFAMEKGGSFVDGPVGAAVAALGATTAFATQAIGTLAIKLDNGSAKWVDIVHAATTIEAALYSIGSLSAAAGLSTPPGALIGVAILSAGAFVMYHRNPVAALDALEVAWEGVGKDQPWTFLANAAAAYSAEIDRQKTIDAASNAHFNLSLSTPAPRDPLVLDLDGDGIEALAINPSSPTLFDHNADGIRTATGWISPDDGLVVLDLDGNGTIDSGRELFGDNTLLANGRLARNGYEALAQHDANQDGRIDSADANFDQLHIWRDPADGSSGSLRHGHFFKVPLSLPTYRFRSFILEAR